MLKKAGLIAAASVASLVAVSPLAFAGGDVDGAVSGHGHDKGHSKGHGHNDKGHGHSGGNQNSSGVVNALNGNNIESPIQLCNNDIQGQVGLVPIQDVGENPSLPGLNGALGLLGAGKAVQDNHVSNTRACGADTGGAGYGNH